MPRFVPETWRRCVRRSRRARTSMHATLSAARLLLDAALVRQSRDYELTAGCGRRRECRHRGNWLDRARICGPYKPSRYCAALLAAKPRLGLEYKDGQSVLHAAVSRGNREIVNSLIVAGAAVDAVDANGNTPLDEAVLHGQGDAVRVLLAHGADARRVHSAAAAGHYTKPYQRICGAGETVSEPVRAWRNEIGPVRRRSISRSPKKRAHGGAYVAVRLAARRFGARQRSDGDRNSARPHGNRTPFNR